MLVGFRVLDSAFRVQRYMIYGLRLRGLSIQGCRFPGFGIDFQVEAPHTETLLQPLRSPVKNCCKSCCRAPTVLKSWMESQYSRTLYSNQYSRTLYSNRDSKPLLGSIEGALLYLVRPGSAVRLGGQGCARDPEPPPNKTPLMGSLSHRVQGSRFIRVWVS